MDTDITDPSFKYAPSQNPIDPLNSSGSVALPNTMTQQVDFVSSGNDFADKIRKQTRQIIDQQNNAMMLSMSRAAAGNAEEAAAAQRLGYETGVGAEIAARNKQLLEQRLATDRLAQLDLFKRDPVLARMLANKDFAAVAHDDLPNLMESGEQINPDLSWIEEFLIGRARGYKGTELGLTGMDMLAAKASGVPIPESLRAKAAQQKQELDELRASGGFLESFGALEGNIESTIPKQAEMALYGAVAGGLILGAPTGGIGMVPGMVAGAGMGVMSAGVVQSFQIEGGNLFVEMLDDGIPEDTALVAAPIGGAIMAALEILPLKFVTGEAKKLIKREVAGQVIDTLKQTGMLDVFKRFLQSYGIGVTTEVGTELAQDAVSTYVQEMAMLATDPLYEEKWKSEKGRAELAKQFLETFKEVGQGMAIMGAFLPGANFIGDARRARKAKATRQFFKDIDKNAKESKLKGRNPRSYQEWYEEKARGTANHTLFIDIEKLREAMAKNNVSAEQLETILPGVTKAIADAKGMSGIDFAFPTSVYAARLSDIAFGQALQEHMRFDPNDMSIAENNQYVKEREQIVEEMKKSAMELMKADAAIDQSAQAVADSVTAQLVATGRYTESESRSMASVASAVATVMSARFNMTPLDWHNKYGSKVIGEGQAAPAAAPLEQAAMQPQPLYPVLAETWKNYFDGEDYGNTSDLADTIEGLIDSDEAPSSLAYVVDQFREEMAYDRQLKGRGDMDTANKAFESAVQAAAEQMTQQQMLEQAVKVDVITDEKSKTYEFVEGKPVTISAFHGTRTGGFTKFDPTKIDTGAAERSRFGLAPMSTDPLKGFWFTNDSEQASNRYAMLRPTKFTKEQVKDDQLVALAAALNKRIQSIESKLTEAEQKVSFDYHGSELNEVEFTAEGLSDVADDKSVYYAAQEMVREYRQLFPRLANEFKLKELWSEVSGAQVERTNEVLGAQVRMENPTVEVVTDPKKFYENKKAAMDRMVANGSDGIVFVMPDGEKLYFTTDSNKIDVFGSAKSTDEIGALVSLSRQQVAPQVLEQAAKADANAINEQASQESDDTVATAESQPNIPTAIDDAISLDSVAKLATSRAWERGRDLKVEMQKEATTLAGGSGVDLLIDTPQTTEYLTRVGLRDALYALRQNPNSVGWYDEKTRQALAVMALVHPEILTDENARFAFTWALAVTSNGIKVGKNFELAEMVYRRYKSDGKMPSDLAAGTSQEAINNSLSLFNTLRDAWGIDNLRRFAQTEYTIQELKYIVADTDSGGEYASTVVKGAAVLGPKIGNGFFSNLYGDFRSLTMDRWLVRTWGRWTGTLIMPMPVQTQNARTRLQTVITALTQDERASMASILREAVPKQTAVIDAVEAGSGVDFDALSSVIQKASMDKEVRAKMNETFAGQEVRKAGNGLAKYLDGQKEAPAGPGERVRIRGIFTTILQQLQQLPEYAELTMADLQAALWYAEKRLYETAKEDITIDEEDIEGYADDEAPDYANAAADVARIAGVSNEKISQTLQRESNNERSRQSRLQEKSGSPVEARNTAATRGFSDNEKRQFNGAAVIRNDRASRGNIAGSPDPYTRSSSKTNTKPRLVKLIRARVVSLFQPQGRLRNALAAAGGEKRPFDTPKFHELEKSEKSPIAFHRLITESKSKSEFGASVYAYTVEEYADMRLFVSEDALSGFALKGDDIVSVFSMSDAAVGHALMQMAVSVGGRRLDAFDTVLPYLYAPHGFRAVARLRWDEGRKPEGWDKKTFAKFNNGEPDVVFMVYDPTYFGQYSNKDGKVAKSEDAAVRVQKKATSNIANGGILEQAMPSGKPRATIDLSTFITTLNTAADLSSYLHEMAHFYMVTYINIANEPGAPPQITADLQIIFDWLGIKDLAAWNAMTFEEQRKYWESFAYNHEIYLFEGKSPSVEMQGVFDRFSAWLRAIYKNIRDELNAIYREKFGEDLPMLTPEIRGVMDRMLATEKQIKYAESVNNMTPLFLTQEQSGYDDARWAAYQAMVQEAHDQSVTDLTKASLRQMEWLSNARTRLLKEMQAKHDDIRDKMRSDIAEEVAAEPVYMAMSVLKTGKGRVANGEMVVFSDKYKLNLAIVKSMIPAENLSKLGYGKFGMLSEDGLHPDMVAEMFGFKSGDELVLALLAAKPVKEEVDSRLDARMLAEYGDMNTPAEIEVQVQKALHNEARERFIGVEARFVASATRPVRVMIDAAQQAASTIVNAQKIENIRPSNYAAAEARAARDAADAYKQRQTPEQARKTSYTRSYNEQIAAGVDEATAVAEATKKGDQAATAAKDRQDAFAAKYGNREPAQVVIRAKQAQVVQNQLVKVSTAALEEVDKALKDFRRFFKADEKIAKNRNMDLVDAARSILAFYGLGKHDKLPSAYTDKLQAYNPEMYEAVKPIIEMSQRVGAGGNHETLTVSEFRMMREVVDALWMQSRRDKQAEIAGKMVSVAQIQGELIVRTEEIGIPKEALGLKQALTENQKRIQHLMSAGAVLQRVENWARRFDGPQESGTVGPATKYIWRPVKNAVTEYKIARNKYVKKYKELLDKVDLPVGKIRSDELDYTFGVGNGGNGKAELLGALMHMGNLSNLRKLLLGRGWGSLNEDGTLDTSRWDAFVERMISEGKLTKEDFEFLQATWDLLEEIKPIAQKAHRDLYGYYFNEIEAKSFTNRFGTYRGGYVPAKTDAMIVRDAQRQAKMEELEADFRASMPSTGMGFTMGRVEYDKPLSMDARLIAGHIDSVLRFAHIQPAIKDVLKIIGRGKFADNLTAIQPFAINDVLLPWLNRTARQTTSVPGIHPVWDKSWNIIRKRTGISIMMGGVRNAMQQFTGWFPAALLVSKGELKNAASTYFRNPMKTAAYVASLSPFMNDFMNSQIFVLQDQMNELLLNPSKYQRFKNWTDHHAYFLQTANQNIVNIVTWLGKYNQVLSEIDASISDSEAQYEAVQQADAAVRLTQGGMSPEDVARFQVGTPFDNSMTQFMGFFNMTANLNADEFVMLFRDLGWRGNKGKLMMIYILGIALPALMSDAISRSLGQGWDDDDDGYLDDVADWFFGSQARYVAGFVPFGSAALTAVTAPFNDKPYDDRITSSPSITSLEASTIGVGKAIINIADDDKELTGRNVRDVLTLITNATGVPVSVLGRPIGYQVDIERGAVEPTDPIDYMRGLITGVPSAESKKK
jgi:hypothetical protein